LSLIDKTPMKANNEEMDKDQLSTSNHQDMVTCFFRKKKLRYINSHPLELIIGNPFKGTKIRASLRNISALCFCFSYKT
jgi:hypothetical protein